MTRNFVAALIAATTVACLTAVPMRCGAEDIDIFVGGTGGVGDPNVLIILDNSSNWSAANQNWPEDGDPPVDCGNDCNKQGYYELKALRKVVDSLPKDEDGRIGINLGLMLFNNSNATRDGGYVRYAVRSMTAANLENFLRTIDEIIQHFNTETASSSVQYGAVLFDAFKYFGGYTNPENASKNNAPASNPTYSGVPVFGTAFWGSIDRDINEMGELKRDAAAYADEHYVPPHINECGRSHIIFIGNGFPAKGNTVPDMGQVLKYLQDPQSPPNSISEFAVTTYHPVTDSCSAVTDGDGASCSDACTTENYKDSFYPDKYPNKEDAFIHKCDNLNKACKKQEKVYKCRVTAWNIETGVPLANAADRYGDEYADFLHKTDVSDLSLQQNITVHTINVYKDKPNEDQEGLCRSMANRGGGKYFSASSEVAIEDALEEIFSEIVSVNSTFASASLPVNATNRAQNENQVFIGMFRPDPLAKPRWFGNLKRYQLALFTNEVRLADADGVQAVNTQTGFITDCARSWWTTDSGSWWSSYLLDPSPAGACSSTPNDPFSDLPDGPQVEKGAVAEVVRKGNGPDAQPNTNSQPTWDVGGRQVKTVSGPNLVDFTAGTSGLDVGLVDFILGKDINDEDADEDKVESRASLHGSVIHSRPLPVNYGEAGITVFYGANDGTLRAVDAATGKEHWAFVAPEFFSKLERLKANEPLVKYPNLPEQDPPAEPMSYYFDGSIGVYQDASNDHVWIYPSMRRGGDVIYALDVTTRGSLAFKWKVDPSDEGFGNLGQTWSIPNVALVAGHEDENGDSLPVIVVGGGYDTCEDENTASPSCGSPKGAFVYVIDADAGTLIRSFPTERRSVAADISLVDADYDGKVDYAYAVDTGGNIYRISLVSDDPDNWAMHRIAYTSGHGRKFLFGPALLPARNRSNGVVKIYLAIGSGDREHPLVADYPYPDEEHDKDGVLNRFYVFVDDPANNAANSVDENAPSLDNTTIMEDFSDRTKAAEQASCSVTGVFPNSEKKGWFIDLDEHGGGEQVVTSPLIVGGMVTFSTNRPIDPPDSCGNVLGEARGYWVNLLNASGAIDVTGNCGGERSTTFVGGGLPPSPVWATVPITNAQGETEVVTVVIGAAQKGGDGGSVVSSGVEGQQIEPTISSRRHRVYWYQEGDD